MQEVKEAIGIEGRTTIFNPAYIQEKVRPDPKGEIYVRSEIFESRRFHHGLLDNGNLGLRQEMLEIMREHLMQQYPDWNEDKLVYKKWDFPTFD